MCDKRSSLPLLVVESDEYTHRYFSTDEGSYSSGVGTRNDDGAKVGGQEGDKAIYEDCNRCSLCRELEGLVTDGRAAVARQVQRMTALPPPNSVQISSLPDRFSIQMSKQLNLLDSNVASLRANLGMLPLTHPTQSHPNPINSTLYRYPARNPALATVSPVFFVLENRQSHRQSQGTSARDGGEDVRRLRSRRGLVLCIRTVRPPPSSSLLALFLNVLLTSLYVTHA